MWHCRILWLTAPFLWSGTTAFLPTNVDKIEAMKILAMNLKFDNDNIEDLQKHELFKHAGYSDYQLYMNQAITKDQYMESVRKTFKDEMVTSILEQGGIDIGQPIWRKLFFNEDPDKIFAEMVGVQEPLKSIIRLIKSDDEDRNYYGQKLLKKLQYKSFNNPNGGVLEQNLDHFLLEDSEGRKKLVKDILSEEWFKNVDDPLQGAILKLWHQSKDLEGEEKELAKQNIKDLQYIQMFEDSLPEFTPVRQEDLYLFYKMTDGRIQASDLINVAMGSEIGPITANDFEYYFGSSAKEFTCRAHDSSIRISCGIKLKPNECYKAGCCYNDDTGCHQNLYGKIGSSVARKLLIDNNADTNSYIASLFNTEGDTARVPTLDYILREVNELPYGVNLHSPFEPYESVDLNAVKYTDGNFNWWDQSTLKGDEFFKNSPNGKYRESIVLSQKQERKKYGRPGFEWKPHGPTASPIFSKIPGLNPTANPLSNGLSSLNDYYGKWLNFANYHDDYACSLIPKSGRTTCMRNFAALVDHAVKGDLCEEAGCCFSEESFLKGYDACYRATDYGSCNPRYYNDFVHKATAENLYDEGVVKKTECGWDGITETECLTNVKCCYSPSGKNGVPWCFHKISSTVESGEGWCEAWSDPKYRHEPRAACFVTEKKSLFVDDDASDINNLVNQDQCESAGCCFDSSLDVSEIDFLTGGLGLTSGPLRCFKKSNPFIEQTINGNTFGGVRRQLIDNDSDSDYDNIVNINSNTDGLIGEYDTPPEYFGAEPWEDWELKYRKTFTCDGREWVDKFKYKRSCGENLTYYQCVYVNNCCYRPNFLNQPACYKPELQRGDIG